MRQNQKQHCIFLGLCLLIGIFLVWRVSYGFNTADEVYYLGTSEMLYRGGRLLVDDWHPSQLLCSFLLVPIYGFIREIIGSTEGIVLINRYLFLFVWICMSILLYLRFQRKGKIAYGPALLLLLFAPFGFYALSYNSIEIAVLILIFAMFSTKVEHSVSEYILYGMGVAFIVLCNPYALILYVVYGIICAGTTLMGKKRNKKIDECLEVKNFLWMSVGAAIICGLFWAFVFQRASIEDVLQNLPHILNDQEHQMDFAHKVARYFELCFKNYSYFFIGVFFLCIVTALDKGRKDRREIYLFLTAVVAIPTLIRYGIFYGEYGVNYFMLPMAFVGLEAYLLTCKKEKRLFCWWYLPAVGFTFIRHLASNTGILAISSSYTVASVVGIFFIGQCFLEIYKEDKKSLKNMLGRISIIATVGMQGIAMVYPIATFAMGDDPMKELHTQMEVGPLKGIYTSEKMEKWYGETIEELDSLGLTEEDHLLVFGVAPWIYLYTDAMCGSYSTWQVHTGSDQVITYYEVHPEKLPDVIYMAHWKDDFESSNLGQYLLEKGYEWTEEANGKIMRKV